ncbi:GTPase Era [Guyparkeria halopsychrophila]|uniref:GTPase Era n=1 Tax=Guyparkeria halopsychrophila TaxID=3139421 RepID=UPI0037C95146
MTSSPRFGHVAIVGRPNVGKSTLVNRLVGQKVSITAPKPQTTRHRITGIVTEPRGQIVLIDTPGLHEGGRDALNRQLNRTARSALEGVDLILFMVQAGQFGAEDEAVLRLLSHVEAPVVLLVNKVDLVNDKTELLPFLGRIGDKGNFAEIYPMSARRRRGLDGLLDLVFSYLPEGPSGYDADQVTTAPVRFMTAEIIREKLARSLHDELPYQTTVMIERFEETDRLVTIGAVIYVARAGQKGIVIGNRGSRLKIVGQQAREAIEHLIEKRVMLDLWVKVADDWADDERSVAALGYQLPE